MRSLIVLLLVIIIEVIYGNVITSIAIDPINNRVYTTELNPPSHLYQIDTTKNITSVSYSHILKGDEGVRSNSLFVANSFLYVIFATSGDIARYQLPLPAVANLTPAAYANIGISSEYLAIPPVYDTTDGFIFALYKTTLVVVDLNNLHILQRMELASHIPSSSYGGTLAYNNVSKKLLLFVTIQGNAPISFEFAIANNAAASPRVMVWNAGPFANTSLSSAVIDYSNNLMWALDRAQDRIIGISTTHPTAAMINIPLPKGIIYQVTVKYDLSTQVAYLVSFLQDSGSFGLFKIDLAQRKLASARSIRGKRASVAMVLDTANNKLYVGLEDGFHDSLPPRMTVIDLSATFAVRSKTVELGA